MQKVQTQKGFTLVEIAIVLVIIGLLLGGVLKGQELITNSKIKSVTQDFENITAAYYAYRDRKGEYPADSTATNAQFWTDLRAEGFIRGAGDVGPDHALDSNAGLFVYVPSAATNLIPNKKMLCASGLQDDYAFSIDNKLDDGVGSTGIFRGILEATAGTAVTTGTATAITEAGSTFFTLCKEI